MRQNDKSYYAAEALYKIATGMPSLWSILTTDQQRYWMREAEPLVILADAIVSEMPEDDDLAQNLV